MINKILTIEGKCHHDVSVTCTAVRTVSNTTISSGSGDTEQPVERGNFFNLHTDDDSYTAQHALCNVGDVGGVRLPVLPVPIGVSL